MPNHKSAKKRVLQTETRRLRNKSYMSSVKSQVKAYKSALSDLAKGSVKKEEVEKLLVKAQSAIAKAGSKGLLHKNTVARRVSRLVKSYTKSS